jgi:hypothetical protein
MTANPILKRAPNLLAALALCAASLQTSSAYAFHLFKHHDDASPAPVVMHTASKGKVVANANAFEKHDWNPFSKRKRYLRRMEKATKAGGFSNINVPFQTSMWSAPKRATSAGIKKLAMPIHLPHRNGARARAVAARPKKHWLIF